jgi:hypothetical protein
MKRPVLRATVGVSTIAFTLCAATYAAQATTSEPASAPASAHTAATKLHHDDAASRLSSSGIKVTSSGGCSDRNSPNCTSLEQVNLTTIQGAQTLKKSSNCDLTVTGGTETGHADGTYSHWNGYKLDFHMTSCLSDYVKGNFSSIGGSKWKSGAGNIYYDEGNHWDVTFHSAG